jgi:Peptidase family M23
MTTYTPHISRGAARRIVLSILVCSILALLGGLVAATSAARSKQAGCGWPVKPFDRPHPVRGSFGDPRTQFAVPPTMDGALTGSGKFSFHFGVDISAPDGTKVYPVVSGTVSQVTHEWVGVDTGGGRSFQYWHIHASVGRGDRAEAGKTVLGTVVRGAEHVHFTELQNGRVVNPLRSGHLTPYEDATKPEVETISLRASETGRDLMPNFVRGRLVLVAEAYDSPQLPVPGAWKGMPVAPALVTWRLHKLGGRTVVPETIAADFRSTIPSNGAFWSYYARGTYQNMSVFAKHYSYAQPGCFLFKLTRTPFDTRRIHDGVYDLIVTATDIQGNHSSLTRRFTVHNRAGWVGS